MRSRSLIVVATALAMASIGLAPAAPAAAAGDWLLTATSQGGAYAPTFTGNGVLGVRVPPQGQGYAGGTVPAQSELAGFYAQPPDSVQQRANIPTWSTLEFSVPGGPSRATISNWRQSLNLHTGVITTTMLWTSGGQSAELAYQVLTDRDRPHVGLVRLRVSPRFSGLATVTDVIDGTPATMSTEVGSGHAPDARRDWVTIRTQGTGIVATLSSQLMPSANVVPYAGPLPLVRSSALPAQSVQQQLTFRMTAGQTYTLTKYVGVVSSQERSDTVTAAQNDAASAASAGWAKLRAANDRDWAALWRDRIDVVRNSPLATIVNASEFYLWSNTRPGVNWSISPAGLSSNGYDGHIFWDAETWMYPSLLAMHPELALGIDTYRYQRLHAAEQHARATGYQGARFPWESALDGTEQIPPPVSVNSEGVYEQHITADIALAQWQYYLATGDRRWLAQRGWPVLEQTARFWASRVTRGHDGRYHINGVTGPDEENPDVNDEAYTNVAAMRTLQYATQAARVLGMRAPRRWSAIAAGLVVPTTRRFGPLIHPEFRGYQGELVKQADVTLLQYPWAFPMGRRLATNDINFYVPRTDPGGPSMSDAVNEIDTSALGTPGCSAYVYTQRSYQPFIRDPFKQFSETRTGGAFTFMTGIGGFLQEFTYGYSGLRLGTEAVSLAPSLTRQLRGLVLRGLSWRGRRFTVAIGQRTTTVTLQSGRPLPVDTPTGRRYVWRRRPLVLGTRRPDLVPTFDRLRCEGARATSAAPGMPALAAVDGSPATGWVASAFPSSLTVPVTGRDRPISRATVLWGRSWPQPPGPNIHPPAGPVVVLRPAAYTVSVSDNGRTWRVVAQVTGGRGTLDRLRLGRVRARYLRLTIGRTGTNGGSTVIPMLEELTAG